MKTTFIYELIEPITDETRYIGKTNNPSYRFKTHIREVSKKNTHKNNWIKSLLKQNLEPVLNIIDEVKESESSYWERFYISLYKVWNCRLTNSTLGGDGHNREDVLGRKNPMYGKHHSEETKKKISQIHKGKPSCRKGVSLSQKTKDKIKESWKNRSSIILSSEKKISKSLKLSLALKGKTFSEEHKKSLSYSKTKQKIKQIDRFTGQIVAIWNSSKELRDYFNISDRIRDIMKSVKTNWACCNYYWEKCSLEEKSFCNISKEEFFKIKNMGRIKYSKEEKCN